MGVVEVIFKVILVSLGVIGAFNIGIACLAMIEKILKELKPKWMYVYIIMTSFGIVALGILLKQ